MENASKALLIAGAILIAILLIAIGMMVFNSASGVVDTATAGMSDQEKTAHNGKFTKFEGTKPGSNVKALLEAIIDHNGGDNRAKVNKVYLHNYDGNGAISHTTVGSAQILRTMISERVVNTAMYDIVFTKDSNGIIVQVDITKK